MVSFEAVGDDTVMVSAEVLATVMTAEAGAAAQRATSRASGARSLRMAGEGTGVRMRTGRAIDGAPGRPDSRASESGRGGLGRGVPRQRRLRLLRRPRREDRTGDDRREAGDAGDQRQRVGGQRL